MLLAFLVLYAINFSADQCFWKMIYLFNSIQLYYMHTLGIPIPVILSIGIALELGFFVYRCIVWWEDCLVTLSWCRIFWRYLKGFMIQGGDPTGTGKGGTSIWGKKYNDEIRESLKVIHWKSPVLCFVLLHLLKWN